MIVEPFARADAACALRRRRAGHDVVILDRHRFSALAVQRTLSTLLPTPPLPLPTAMTGGWLGQRAGCVLVTVVGVDPLHTSVPFCLTALRFPSCKNGFRKRLPRCLQPAEQMIKLQDKIELQALQFWHGLQDQQTRHHPLSRTWNSSTFVGGEWLGFSGGDLSPFVASR